MQPTPLGHGAVLSKVSVQDILAPQIVAMATMPPTDVVITYDHPHFNQKQIGICTAADLIDLARKIFGVEFSVDFTYWGGKAYDGNLYEGSSNVSMMSHGHNVGFLPASMDVGCNNTDGTYEDFLARKHSYTPAQIAEAGKYKIVYARVTDLSPTGLATALASSKYGLITMIQVGDNFYADANHVITWDKARLQYLRSPLPLTGAHSIKIVETHGLDTNQIIKDRNSWGGVGNPTDSAGDIWCGDGDIEYIYHTQQPYVKEAFIVSPASEVVFKHTFSVPIVYGQNSPEVTALQRVLVGLGVLVMPVGVAYGYYGDLTAKAVLAFQIAYNVADPATLQQLAGKNVGPSTRSALNAVQS